MKCKLCEYDEFEYKCIEKDKFIGTYNVKIPQKFLRGNEHDLGTDYYAKEDFLQTICKRCNHSQYTASYREIKDKQ